MGIESALNDLIEGYDKASELDKAMTAAGYDANPYFDIMACIAEAIYHLVGENKDKDYEETSVHDILNSDVLGRKEQVDSLVALYKAQSN